MNMESYMQQLGKAARAASRVMAAAETGVKNNALLAMATALDEAREELMQANARDLEQGRKQGLDAALLDRLELTPERIDAMIEGVRQVAALADPIGAVSELTSRPSGIQVGRIDRKSTRLNSSH